MGRGAVLSRNGPLARGRAPLSPSMPCAKVVRHGVATPMAGGREDGGKGSRAWRPGQVPAMNDAALRIESDAKTHEGRVRAMNEDNFIAREGNGFWAVADGMGGHENGEWASAQVVEEFEGISFPESFDQGGKRIVEAIVSANRTVHGEAMRRGIQMGSTIVALYMRERRYAVFWVGDSRAYRLRGRDLERLSRDHSQVQEMVDRGLLQPEDAIGHPMGHVLTRAVGVGPNIEIDRADGDVEPGDTFLLCSDGLHDYVDEADIMRLLGRGSPGEASEQLVVRTLECGAPDNVTVVAISVSEPTQLTFVGPGSGSEAAE